MGAVLSTALGMAGVFLAALSPLLVVAALVRAWHWVGRGGRHRRRGPAASAAPPPARPSADGADVSATGRTRSRSETWSKPDPTSPE